MTVLPLHAEPPTKPDNEKPRRFRRPPPESIQNKREVLNRLASLPEDKLEAALERWPPYQEMDIGQRGALLQRIQKMRDRRQDEAKRRAKDLGLDIPESELDAFTNTFWERKLTLDREFWEAVGPLRKKYDTKLNDELLEEFAKYRKPESEADSKKD